MEWQTISQKDCVKQLDTDRKKGLSEQQARSRLEHYGTNELKQAKKVGLIRRFFRQFADFMVIILLIAAGISFVTSYVQKDSDYIDSIIILCIVIINAITGVVQESRAEQAIASLQKLSAPESTVIRGGKQKKIPSSQLVPGDMVVLSAGNLVSADIRLLESYELKAEESALTGESVPSEKDAAVVFPAGTPIGDQKNMLFSGSSISTGRGMGVVVATAMETQVGKIAHMIHTEDAPETPLQHKLSQTGKVLGIGAIIICAIIFLMGLLQQINALEMFMISISLAVAAIPEGLPAVVTIVLAIGMRRMAAKRAIIRRLPAVETLGSASVICSDKTGTLTQNKMTVTALASAGGKIALHSAEGNFILELGTLCTDCTEEGGAVLGEPTEVAIVNACGTSKQNLEQKYPRVSEIAFSSARKMMTTVHRLPGGGYRIITKGAPDLLLAHCTAYGKGSAALGEPVRQAILRQNDQMASQALRILGVAFRDVVSLPPVGEMEKNLSFLGLIGMIDPPRPQAKEAVRLCRKAGIRAVMITGDHAVTATAIARDLGILNDAHGVMTGAELDRISQQKLTKEISRFSVFARVTPEHKVRIVKAFQARGEVVAMTGDGVNDAPALKAADIGCAMGKSGTDVAKNSADMIMTDDNFATIVAAVREGRGIYDNIKKTVHFLISCNIGEILTVFVAFLLHLPAPLLAIQLLWVNLVTDSLPALALGVEPIEDDIMERKPEKASKGIFSGSAGYHIMVEGCLIGALALLAYTIGRVFFDGNPAEPLIGRTMAFVVLSLSQVVHTFNVHSHQSVFQGGFLRNPRLIGAAAICVLLQVSVVVVGPLSALFQTVSLSGMQWLLVVGLSLVPLVAVELEKRFLRKKHVSVAFWKKR